MKKSWYLLAIVLFFIFLFPSILHAQKRVTDYELITIFQLKDAARLDPGFRVFCADAQGNRLTKDVLPVFDSNIVSEYKNFLRNGDSPFPLSIETGFVFPIQFPLIFNDVYLNLEDAEESDNWTVPNQRISIFEFYNDSIQLLTEPLRRKHSCRKAVITLQPIKEKAFVQEFLGEIQNDSAALALLQRSVRLDKRLVERDGWQFEKSWFKVKGKDGGYIQTLYRVRKAIQDDWMATLLGEQYENEKSLTIIHPDVRDVNFDGVPDLHVLKGSNGHDVYYGMNVQSGKFEELFISRLMNLKIDYVLEQVEGDILEYEVGIDEPLAKVHYQIKGKHYAAVHRNRQAFREPLNNLKPKIESDVLYSETRDEFHFELQNLSDEVTLGRSHQRLIIATQGKSRVLFEDSVACFCNPVDNAKYPWFLVVKDYNHDDVPDVYFPKRCPGNRDVFYLSEKVDGNLTFNESSNLSYPEARMMHGDFEFSSNKMVLREYDDFNLDGWLDYRVYTQMGRSEGFWSYFIFSPLLNTFQHSISFSLLDHCSVNRKTREIVAWKQVTGLDGSSATEQYCLSNGVLNVVK
jgi:hypothetical protein